jgi:hypothetical protein
VTVQREHIVVGKSADIAGGYAGFWITQLSGRVRMTPVAAHETVHPAGRGNVDCDWNRVVVAHAVCE